MRWTILASVLLAIWLVSESPGQDKSKPQAKGEKQPTTAKITSIADKTLDQWIEEIKDRDKGKSENAIRTVLLFGQEDAQKAVPVLIAELKKPPPIDTSIRVNIPIALGIILGGYLDANPSDVRDAVAILKRSLTDNQSIVKMRAAEALGRIGEDARSAVPDLLQTLKDPFTWETRCASAVAIGAIGREPAKLADKNVVQSLYNRLQYDDTAQVRLASIKALARFGPFNKNPDVQKTFNSYLSVRAEKDPDKTVRVWAEVAMMTVNGVDEKRLRHLGSLLHSKDDMAARVQAGMALGGLGTKAASQVNALIRALDDADAEVVVWAAWALGRIGTQARPAVPSLQRMLKTENPALKQTLQESIDAIEGKAKSPEKKGSFLCPEPRWLAASSPLFASSWAPEPFMPSQHFWARIAATGRKS
jgi:HEAT repeat protein